MHVVGPVCGNPDRYSIELWLFLDVRRCITRQLRCQDIIIEQKQRQWEECEMRRWAYDVHPEKCALSIMWAESWFLVARWLGIGFKVAGIACDVSLPLAAGHRVGEGYAARHRPKV